MLKDLKLLKTALTLFGEGGADGGADVGVTPEDATQDVGGEAEVKYGKQTDTEAPQEVSEDATRKQAKVPFKDLINGEYKEDFDNIFSKRFKDHKDLQKKVSDQSAIIDRLMSKYSITDGNLQALTDAIDNDDAMWMDAADEQGMTVEQYKTFSRLERENNRLIEQETSRLKQEQMQAEFNGILEQSAQLKSKYPDFDLEAELQNPEFVRLVRDSKVPVEHAYRVIHFDELQNQVATNVARETEKKVTDSVRARGTRPLENGTTSQSAFIVKDDPSKWDDADMDEVIRRVQRGEKIKL